MRGGAYVWAGPMDGCSLLSSGAYGGWKPAELAEVPCYSIHPRQTGSRVGDSNSVVSG